MTNIKWHRDEIILALDLYYKFKAARRNPSPQNTQVINISDILNRIPRKEKDIETLNHKNPDDVCKKLSELKSLDPDNSEHKIQGVNKLDDEIFFEFLFARKDLEESAQKIISDSKNRPLRRIQTYGFEESLDDLKSDAEDDNNLDIEFLNNILFDEMEDSPTKTWLLEQKRLADGMDVSEQEKDDKINKSKEYSTSTFVVEIPNNDDSLNLEKTDNDDEIPNNDNSLNIEKTDSNEILNDDTQSELEETESDDHVQKDLFGNIKTGYQKLINLKFTGRKIDLSQFKSSKPKERKIKNIRDEEIKQNVIIGMKIIGGSKVTLQRLKEKKSFTCLRCSQTKANNKVGVIEEGVISAGFPHKREGSLEKFICWKCYRKN